MLPDALTTKNRAYRAYVKHSHWGRCAQAMHELEQFLAYLVCEDVTSNTNLALKLYARRTGHSYILMN
jgi:hypothetical protein